MKLTIEDYRQWAIELVVSNRDYFGTGDVIEIAEDIVRWLIDGKAEETKE